MGEQSSDSSDREDELAWNLLIERHHPGLEKNAMFYWNGDEEAAKDTVQATWIKVFGNIATFRGGGGGGGGRPTVAAGEDDSFRRWLYTILKNQFRDDLRKKKRLNSNLPLVSLDTPGPDEEHDENEGGIEWWVNHIRVEEGFEPDQDYLGSIVPPVEQSFMDEEFEDCVKDLIRGFLSKGEADFFLAYQAGLEPKAGKDKVKYHRYGNKLMRGLIREWVKSGRSLSDVMPPRQANILTDKYSLGRREADIFKDHGITGKEELGQLLADGKLRLFKAYCDEGMSQVPTGHP